MPYLEWREVPEPFERRLEIAKNPEKKYLEPNCYGTSLFLAGVLPWDLCVYTDSRNNYIPRLFGLMKKVDTPQDNSIVLFVRNGKSIEHSAYIRTVNPFEAFQRTGCCGSFDEPLESLEGAQPYLDSIFPKVSSWFPNVKFEVDWTKKFYVLPDFLGIAGYFKRKNLDLLVKEIVEGYCPSG